MSTDYPNEYGYPEPMQQTAVQGTGICTTLVSLATIGAVVGASAAAGGNIVRVQREELTARAALADTGKAAVAGAAATAVAGLAASAVANEGLARIAVLFATGTAVMYGIQRRWGASDTSGETT